MKITGTESSTLRRSLEGSNSSHDLTWHLAWRRALEQAQWEEHTRHQATGDGGGAPPMADAPPALPEPSHRDRTALLAVPDQAIPSSWRPGTSGNVQLPPTAPSPISAAPPQTDIAVDVGFGTAPLRATTPARERSPLAPGPRVPVSLPEDWAQWLPRTMHMNVQGQQVRASVRDESLDELQAQRLFHRMRGQLRDWGLDLVELIVNGHPAQPEEVDAPQKKEENHGS